jgi:hypothetical protein
LFHDYCESRVGASFEEIVCKQRDRAWSKVLDSLTVLAKRTNLDDACQKKIRETCVTVTLCYFGICKQSIHRSGQSFIELAFRGIDQNSDGLMRAASPHSPTLFSTKITSSLALAQFYKKVLAQELYSCISLAIKTSLQSPWLDQCEASCLLHIALFSLDKSVAANTNEFDFDDYHLDLAKMLSEKPPSILLDGSPSTNFVLGDPKVQSLCDNAFSTLLSCAIGSPENLDSSLLYNNITLLWKSLLEERGAAPDTVSKSKPSSPTKSSMRVLASIAGAVVHCGSKYLPDKITPIIQSLMTSLKSEVCGARSTQTCCYISLLVNLLSENPVHHRARNKLLENICFMASEVYTESGETSSSTAWARYTLELIAVETNYGELQEIPPIWDKLSMLTDASYSSSPEQKQLEAVLVLSIISKASTKQRDCLDSIVSSFAKPAIHIACNNESSLVRNQASESILNLCSADFELTMNAVITWLLPILADLCNQAGRAGGCEMLVAILQKFSISVSPHVITLLPLVMRLMTDTSEECARHASTAFAILVRIAPFSASYIDQNENVVSTSNKVSEDVIRHLILGKPLPPCILPSSISQTLIESETVIRPYQMEGISWLKFLADVHLNGALCDDMG